MDMPILSDTEGALARTGFLLGIQRQLVDRWLGNDTALSPLQGSIRRQGVLFGTAGSRVSTAQASDAAIRAIRVAAGGQEHEWIDDYKASISDVYDLLRLVPLGSLDRPLWPIPSMVEMAWGPSGDVEPYGVDYSWLAKRLGLRATYWGIIAGKRVMASLRTIAPVDPINPVFVRFAQPWASMVKRAWPARLYPAQFAVQFGLVRTQLMARANEWLRTIGVWGLDGSVLPELSSPEVDVYGANPSDERNLLQAGLRIRRKLI